MTCFSAAVGGGFQPAAAGVAGLPALIVVAHAEGPLLEEADSRTNTGAFARTARTAIHQCALGRSFNPDDRSRCPTRPALYGMVQARWREVEAAALG